jgi:CheY-like chemotaxis protein
MITTIAMLALAADAATEGGLVTQVLVGLGTLVGTVATVVTRDIMARRKAPEDCSEALTRIENTIGEIRADVRETKEEVSKATAEVNYLAGRLDGHLAGQPHPAALPPEHTPSRRRRLRVVVVDDEADVRSSVQRRLSCEDWDVFTVATVPEALPFIHEERCDVLVTDWPEHHEVLRREAGGRGVPVVVYTGRPDVTTPDGMVMVSKAARPEVLVAAIRDAAGWG